MSWIAVGVAAVGATTSYMNNQAKKKQEKNAMEANAEAMRYSPWTGNKPQMMSYHTGSDLGAIVGGGMQGAMVGSQFGKGGGSGGDSGTSEAMAGQQKLEMPAVGAPEAPAPGPSVGGGADYSARLQSPTMPNAADMNSMQAQGQLAGGSQGSPWNNMASLKKPNMYGSSY